MRVTSKDHDGIIVIDVIPEGRESYACLWMRVYLDPEHGQMLSDSDVGNYAHRWPETGKRFLKLMACVGKDYLLDKCCYDRKEYDTESIVKGIHEYFEDFTTEDEGEWDALQEFLDDLDECSDVFGILRVFDDTSFDYGDAFEYISKSYTPWQKRWAEYFHKYVEPEVRKLLPYWLEDDDEV